MGQAKAKYTYIYEERVARMKTRRTNSDAIRLVSYNILAEDLATEAKFVKSPRESLPMTFRIPILKTELLAYDADIVCLQECDHSHFQNELLPFLAEKFGMEGRHAVKPRHPNDTQFKHMREGLAIFYRSGKYTLLESHYEGILLADEMKGLYFYTQIKSRRLLNRLNGRNTIVQLTPLMLTNDKTRILLIANTHLYSRPDAAHIRLLQIFTVTALIKRKIVQLNRNYPSASISVLLCGDLNSLPDTGPIRFLETGKIGKDDPVWTSSNDSAEKLVPGFDLTHKLYLTTACPRRELTNIVHDFEGCLDYVFHQSSFEKVNPYPPPSKQTLIEISGSSTDDQFSLPNKSAPSDHLPIVVDLEGFKRGFKRKSGEQG